MYVGRGAKFAAHAEFACVAEDGFLARKPATMTFEEAGTVFVGAACSLYFLRRTNVKPGERVLVHGASGSLTLDEIAEAHRYADAGHKIGNVAVLIGNQTEHPRCRDRTCASMA